MKIILRKEEKFRGFSVVVDEIKIHGAINTKISNIHNIFVIDKVICLRFLNSEDLSFKFYSDFLFYEIKTKSLEFLNIYDFIIRNNIESEKSYNAAIKTYYEWWKRIKKFDEDVYINYQNTNSFYQSLTFNFDNTRFISLISSTRERDKRKNTEKNIYFNLNSDNTEKFLKSKEMILFFSTLRIEKMMSLLLSVEKNRKMNFFSFILRKIILKREIFYLKN